MHPKRRVVKFLSVISVIAILTVLPGILLFETSVHATPEPSDPIETQVLQSGYWEYYWTHDPNDPFICTGGEFYWDPYLGFLAKIWIWS